MADDTEIEAVTLLTVTGLPSEGKIHVAVGEGMEPMGETQAGRLLADIAQNLEIAYGWGMDEMQEAFNQEMDRPTDRVRPSC